MASTPISAYGKLPLSREFLMHACEQRGARAVTDLVHEAARPLAEMKPGGDALRVYFPLADGRTGAAMSLWPSSDEGGKRRFPFGMFELCAFTGPVSHPGFCSLYTPLHEKHAEVYASLEGLENPREFEAAMKDQVAPALDAKPEKHFEERASAINTTRWAASIYGSETRRLAMALWRIRRLAGGQRSQPVVGIRLPLADEHNLEAQADAWLGLLRNTVGSTPWPSLIAGRFADGRRCLALFFRPLQPNDFAAVGQRAPRSIMDLTFYKELADLNGFDGFAARIDSRLRGGHASLRELPDILAGL